MEATESEAGAIEAVYCVVVAGDKDDILNYPLT